MGASLPKMLFDGDRSHLLRCHRLALRTPERARGREGGRGMIRAGEFWGGITGGERRILERYLRHTRYLLDPVGWHRDVLGGTLWGKQREIARAVRDHRLVAVHSAQDVGKSYVAAVITCWWIVTHPVGDAFVVTTAPTQKQVEAVLWRE